MSEDSGFEILSKPPEQRVVTGRCKYTHIENGIEKHSCWRPSWKGDGRCIWHHEDSDSKSYLALGEAQSPIPEYLDGAVLDGIDLRSPADQDDEQFVAFIDELKERVSEAEEQIVSLAHDTEELQNRFPPLSFRDCSVREADFSDATLDKTDFDGADLTRSDLSGARLHGANLVGADLSEANLSGATVEEANFASATLTGLSISKREFKQSRITLQTIFNTIEGIDENSQAHLKVESLTEDRLTAGELSTFFARVEALYRIGHQHKEIQPWELNLHDTATAQAETFRRIKIWGKFEGLEPSIETELIVDSISKESPLAVTFFALIAPLIFAIVISGGGNRV